METPIADWIRANINRNGMAMLHSGQVDPNSTMGQAMIANQPIDTSMSNPTLAMLNPVNGPSNPTTAQYFQRGITPQAPAPTNAGQGFNHFKANAGGQPQTIIPQPPPRPADLGQSLNDQLAPKPKSADNADPLSGLGTKFLDFLGLHSAPNGSPIDHMGNYLGQIGDKASAGLGSAGDSLTEALNHIFGSAADTPSANPQAGAMSGVFT